MTTAIFGGMSTLAERIKFAQMKLGVDQNEVDRRLGKKTGYISRVMSDGRNPRLDSMQLIAKALEVDFLWLSTGHGAAPEGWRDVAPPQPASTTKPVAAREDIAERARAVKRETKRPSVSKVSTRR